MVTLIPGDCLEQLKSLSDNSVDSLITDPPAGISFMGKDWDSSKGGRDNWIAWMSEVMRECHRVLKPGAHGLVWAIPRTSHWTATALENAGFEVRDVVTHLFGSGFPKSLNISKQICKQYECQYIENAKIVQKNLKYIPLQLPEDKADFVAANVVIRHEDDQGKPMAIGVEVSLKDPMDTLQFESTELIDLNMILSLSKKLDEEWLRANSAITLTTLKMIIDLKIWSLLQYPNTLRNTINLNGTSLKPASEHWILVRKPCSEKTVAANVLKWGTGGINIDGCRVEAADQAELEKNWDRTAKAGFGNGLLAGGLQTDGFEQNKKQGRFPANLVLSHNEDCTLPGDIEFPHDIRFPRCTEDCPVRLLDEQSIAGGMHSAGSKVERWDETKKHDGVEFLSSNGAPRRQIRHGDTGGASRFFKNFDTQGIDDINNECNANTVEKNLFQQNELEDSVQKLAAIADVLEGKQLKSSIIRFTNDILSKLKNADELTTQQMRSSAEKFLLELGRIEASRLNLANLAEIEKLIDITLIILKLLWSNGYAESATLESTSLNLERGERVCASKFLYCAKASKRERNEGLEGMPEKETYVGHVSPHPQRDKREQVMRANHHPTVKPQKLMQYLITLITPPNGVVLDPFMGSGSTGVAAKKLGFRFIGIEREKEYMEIAQKRIG